MSALAAQFRDLERRYPGSSQTPLPSGAVLISVPQFRLGPGWSAPFTTVRFMAPAGYPFAKPDCFWAAVELRLENGNLPQSANVNTIPETAEAGLWFSWHLTHPWDPNRDDLLTWLASIAERFRSAR